MEAQHHREQQGGEPAAGGVDELPGVGTRRARRLVGGSNPTPATPGGGSGGNIYSPAGTALMSGQLLVGACALASLLWILRRGPLVAPIALFSAANSTNGFFSYAHILPLMALAGGLAGGLMLLSRRTDAPSPSAALAFALPLLALWAAEAHALYPHDARTDLEGLLATALLFFAFVAAVGTRGGIPAALFCLAAIGVWLALSGLRQFSAGQPTPVAWTGPAVAAIIPVRISATLRNPNVLGAALLLCIGGATGLAVGTRSVLLRLAGLVALLPMAAALPLTFSRAAYLGLFLCVFVTILAVPAERRSHALLAAACITLAAGLVALRVPGVLFRVHGISVQHGGDVASRFFTWHDALSVLHARPLLGAGPGGLEVLYAAHAPLGAHGTYTLIDVPGSADNDLLQWAAESGLVGTAALLFGIALLAWVTVRGLRRRGTDARAVGAALAAALLGVALQGGFEVTAFVLPVQALLCLTAAILIGAAGASGPVRPPWLGRGLGSVVALGALACAITLHAPWAAQQAFAQAWPLVESGHPAAALPGLEAAHAADPASERDAAAAGDAAVQAAYAAGAQPPASLLATARTDLSAALSLDPFDGDVWAATAALLRLRAPSPASACAQQAALKDFPYSPDFAAQLASDLRAVGHTAAARTDAAYAAWIFPLQLSVYREHGDQNTPYYRRAEATMRAGLAGWGTTSPLPHLPALPLPVADCVALLHAQGLPGAPFYRAMRGS